MASMQIRPSRRLRELLEEEQEPFILDAYLLERVYSKNASKPPEFSLDKPNKVLNKSASCHVQRIKKGALFPSKLLKSAYNKFVLINKGLRTKNCDGKDGEIMSRNSNLAERFSSASSSTLYNSCPESESGEEEASTSLHCQDHTSDNSKSCNQRKEEALTDRKLRVKHSSVTSCSCEETENTTKRQEEVLKPTEESILSASFWEMELLVCSTAEMAGWFQVAQLLEFNASSQSLKFKRVVLQNQRLLFDSLRELIQNNTRRKECSSTRLFPGSEEIGKLICEKIKEWGKQSAKETSINELMNLDFQESADEWNDMKPEKSEFAMAIGDDILEELGNQLVIDMLHSFSCLSTSHCILPSFS